jgi:hypothetical protein
MKTQFYRENLGVNRMPNLASPETGRSAQLRAGFTASSPLDSEGLKGGRHG